VGSGIDVVVTDSQPEEEPFCDDADDGVGEYDIAQFESGRGESAIGVTPPAGQLDHDVLDVDDGADEHHAPARSRSDQRGLGDSELESSIARAPDAGRLAKGIRHRAGDGREPAGCCDHEARRCEHDSEETEGRPDEDVAASGAAGS
jgi:hypothetical protein